MADFPTLLFHELKRRNPRFGCPRIAQQINKAFGTDIDKDVVRRILATHYRPDPDGRGPSWLTFLGHTKDSLWNIDLSRCESILLQSHWVLVVMDQFARRIIGFGVHAGDVDGVALCRMFNTAISSSGVPKCLSSDNDPLFLYHLKIKADGYNIDIFMDEEILDKYSRIFHSPSNRSQNQRKYVMYSTVDAVVQKTDLDFQANAVCWLD